MEGESRFRLLSLDQFQSLPPPTWLIDGVLPAGSEVMVFGAPGEGKSFLALDWALSIATGQTWQGREVRVGPVIYVAAEGAPGLSRRTIAWMRHHDFKEIDNAFFIVDAPQLHVAADVDHLITAVRGPNVERPAMIILDTFARTFVGGDENQAGSVGLWVAGAARLRKEFDCTVTAVHHTTKRKVKGQPQERGSTLFRGAANTMVLVRKSGRTVTVECAKQKDAEEFAPIVLQMIDVSWIGPRGPESSCVLVGDAAAIAAPTPDTGPSKRQLVLLQVVGAFGEAETKQIIAGCVGKIGKRNVAAELNALLDMKLIERVKKGFYRITDMGRLDLQLQENCE